ncbi:MAG: hypothetical protein NTX61_07370 [Bacteroidetes bacterium]|nr:hypothetical protein [Bacteroidota bacterium]
MAHLLHEEVAKAFESIAPKHGLIVQLDEACVDRTSGKILQHLPFFLSVNAHNDTEITNVDLMLSKNDKVKLVCEIEESDISPVRTYGKAFTAATAIMCQLVDDTRYDVDKNGVFIQVLSNHKLPVGSNKQQQGVNIEVAINDLLRYGGSWIKKYYLIYGDVNDFKPGNRGYVEIEKIVKLL